MLPFYQVQKSDLSLNHNLRELNYRLHMHNEIEILYMRKGTQKIRIDQKEYDVHQGEAAIIFPEQLHEYVRSKKNATDEIILICSPNFYRSYFPDMSDKVPKNPIIMKEAIHPDALYALEHIEINDSFTAKVAFSIMIMTRFFEYMELKKIKKIYVKDISYKVIEYIREHFVQDISLESIAKEFSVNKNYISHIFSSKLEINFRKYLGLIRAEYAATLLRTTDDKVAVVALNAGFESQRTFHRVFREIYGITPVEFRKKLDRYKNS